MMDVRIRILQILKDRWEGIDTFASAVDSHSLSRTDEFFFIQIGANDGVRNDPIYKRCRSFNWKGLLIEPQKEMFEKLKNNYCEHQGLIFENVAISDGDREQKLWKIAAAERSEWHTGIATLQADKGDILFESSVKNKELESEIVHVTTLHALTGRHGINKSNLILLDTEGHELTIIGSDGFFESKPDIVHYEHKHLSFVEQDKCIKILSANGYKMYCGSTETTALKRSP